MVSLDHGTHSVKGFVQEGSWSLLADFEKNVHKKKLDLWQEKKIWEQLTTISRSLHQEELQEEGEEGELWSQQEERQETEEYQKRYFKCSMLYLW